MRKYTGEVRVCVICHERTRHTKHGVESTVGMQTALKSIRIEGDKVHPTCYKEAVEAYKDA